MKEEKIRTVFKALENINQNEWLKLKHTIDQYFDIEASKQANSIFITSSNEMMNFYSRLF